MGIQVHAQTYVFATLQGTPVNTAGWTTTGAAAVGNTPGNSSNSEIILTNTVNTSSGAIFYQTPVNLSLCRKWYVEFDFRMFDGNMADGISFCYLDVPPTGFVNGAGMGIPATANGLKVCFDTYKNCGTDAVPKIEIRYGIGYDECNGQPTRSNNDGKISFLRNNNYSHAKIEYDQGNISVYVNNLLYLTAFQTFLFPGYFGFTASTGGSTDRHSIKNVQIYTEMPPSVAGAPIAICPKDSIQIGSAANTNYTYQWTPAAGLSSATVANPKVSWDNASLSSYKKKYYVETSFASNPGCASKDSVEISVKVRPQINFTSTLGCMPNAYVQFTDQTIIGDALPKPAIYNWDFGDANATPGNPNTISAVSPMHTYTAPGPYNVHVSGTSSQGCTADTTLSIVAVRPRPKALLQATSEVCLHNIISVTDNSNDMGTPITVWHWSFGDGGSSLAKDTSYKYLLAGNQVIKHWVENGNGCISDTAQTTVTINPLPKAGFSTSSIDYCQGTNLSFSDTSKPNAGSINSWKWDFGDGVQETLQNPTHTYLNYGTSTIRLMIGTDKGCGDTAMVPITVHALPIVDFTVSANCANSAAVFTNGSQTPDNTSASLAHVWHFNDANATPFNLDSSLSKDPTHTFIAGGIYQVKLEATSSFGCKANKIIAVPITGRPQLILKWSPDKCSNVIQSFIDSSTVAFGNMQSRSVYWDWANNPTSVVTDNAPVAGKLFAHQYPRFGGTAPKTYVIKNVGITTTGCPTEKFDTITVLPSPQLTFDPIDGTCMDQMPFSIAKATEITGMIGVGTYFGLGSTPLGLYNAQLAGAGNHKILYTFVASNSCIDTVSSAIQVFAAPTADAGPAKAIIAGGSAVLDGSFSTNVSTIHWAPSRTLNDSSKARPLASPTVDTWYYVTASTDNNCQASDSVFVKVLPALKIPNVFSPNGDGINDVWNIPYLNSYLGCVMTIFDRYGKQVFSSVGYNLPWDATLKGKPLPVGTYYYILDIKNNKSLQTGSITVLR